MTLPTIDGLHYVGCHCNDVCACFDPIECIHEQCICDRLSTAYQHGREDAAQAVASRLAELLTTSPAILASQEAFDAFVDAANSIVAAARGDGEQA